MDVSVIIVTYNTKQMTLECIQSIFQQTNGVVFEIILVDNASNDGSKELFEQYEGITYIYSNKNLGFGKANNLGYQYANGEYIFLLISDTILLNNAIFYFYESMKKASSDIGCMGCILFDIQNKPMHSYGYFPKMKHFFERIANFNIPNIIKRTDLPESNDNYPKYVDYITGADLFIRRSTIDNGGLFDPDFFMYFEETEMQYRYAKLGVKRQIINTPQIRHLAGGSSNKNRKHSLSSLILEMKSRYIYCRKVMPSLSYHIIGLMHLLMIPRILVCRSPLNEKKRLIKLIFKNI